jgi:hypothetical protein
MQKPPRGSSMWLYGEPKNRFEIHRGYSVRDQFKSGQLRQKCAIQVAETEPGFYPFAERGTMSVWREEARKTPEAKGSSGQPWDWVANLVAYLQSIQKPVQQATLRRSLWSV